MSSLPKPIHQRLASEFSLASKRVADTQDIDGKLYYFSVFHGETGRQLNMHWNADLALLFLVVQTACQQIANRVRLPVSAGFPPDGISEEWSKALDDVSRELALAFRSNEIDLVRLYAALARTAELTYATTGNGAYLYQKGMINLSGSVLRRLPSNL